MKKILASFALSLAILTISCNQTAKNNNNNSTTVTYNYSTYTYVGYTYARFEDVVNSVSTVWDSLYFDTLTMKVDSAKDRIVFIVNQGNPVGVYPQFEYPFTISSNWFRHTFFQNYYQSFFFEGDTLKSYFYRLQQGVGVSYQKEISFAGYLLK